MKAKHTIGEINEFVIDGYSYNRRAKELCVELLSSEEFPTHSINFEWEFGDAPSIVSISFGDDVADCYVTKIYIEDGILKVNLHAYYIGEDKEDIDLSCECNIDYLDLLNTINSYRN